MLVCSVRVLAFHILRFSHLECYRNESDVGVQFLLPKRRDLLELHRWDRNVTALYLSDP